jgi:hypothetical protein
MLDLRLRKFCLVRCSYVASGLPWPRGAEFLCCVWVIAALEILKLAAGVRCAVVGTLYKQMQLKPSILDEYTKEVSAAFRHLAPPLSLPSSCQCLPPSSLMTCLPSPVCSPTPSPLAVVCAQRSAPPLVAAAKLVHAEDYLILEDMSGRIRLTGEALDPARYTTGQPRPLWCRTPCALPAAAVACSCVAASSAWALHPLLTRSC